MTAVRSVLKYWVELSAEALNKEIYRMRLAQVQAAIRVYLTIAEPAILVVVGVSVKLLQERGR